MTTDAERLAEVRRRVIRDFHDGANEPAARWWACGVCSWIWPDGAEENHEPSCPLREER